MNNYVLDVCLLLAWAFPLFTVRVGDEALIAIGQGCSLSHLNVSGCHKIGDAGIIAIARGCPQLSYLDISVLQVRSLSLSLPPPSPLPCMRVCDRHQLAPGAWMTIPKGRGEWLWYSFVSLLHLHRWWSSVFHCVRWFGGMVFSSVEKKRGKKRLFCFLSGDWSSIHSFYHSNFIRCLRRDIPSMTICIWCYISFPQNLGDMALAELSEGCPLLKEVVLSHCRKITDAGLSHLVKSCTMLESCHMVYCPGITQAGVATVISSCPSLKKVLVEKYKVSERTRRRAGSVITYLCVDL